MEEEEEIFFLLKTQALRLNQRPQIMKINSTLEGTIIGLTLKSWVILLFIQSLKEVAGVVFTLALDHTSTAR